MTDRVGVDPEVAPATRQLPGAERERLRLGHLDVGHPAAEVDLLRPPDWPDRERPQQFHLDVRVADIGEAEPKALALGARKLPGGGGDFRVYADPVGHPFCLVWDAA